MMRKCGLLFLSLCLLPTRVWAQATAPEMFGVKEVVVEYARFDDSKTADACGLSREQIAADLAHALTGSGVPFLPAAEATPPAMGVARIQLIPQISSHTGDNLDCTSWVSLSAESHTNAVISPVTTPRSITAVYWRHHMTVSSGQSAHPQRVAEAMQKMVADFTQQYRADQPPTIIK